MAEKIKNVKVSYSSEYFEKEWAELIAKRNKLLLLSDWTQLDDAHLSSSCVLKWQDWRKSLRAIKPSNYDNYHIAKNEFEQFKTTPPENTYIEFVSGNTKKDTYEITKVVNESIDPKEIKKLIIKQLKEINNKREPSSSQPIPKKNEPVVSLDELILVQYEKNLESLSLECGPRDIILERSEQAIDYVSENYPSNLETFPFIKIKSEVLNIDPKKIAKQFISDRKKWLKLSSLLEEKYWFFKENIVKYQDSDEKLITLREEIKQPWILT